MAELRKLIDAQGKEIIDSKNELKKRVKQIIDTVEIGIIALLTARLKMRYGRVLPTAGNVKVLQDLPDMIERELEAAGIDAALVEYLGLFDAQYQMFSDIAAAAGISTEVSFTPQDKEFFTARKAAAVLALMGLFRIAAQWAQMDATAILNGATVAQMGVAVGERLAVSTQQVATVAETQLWEFARTVADVGYGHIQKAQPKPLTFRYMGPGSGDPVIRPFCRGLMEQTESGSVWTREEIDQMDNGQIPSVFISCGGYNCRHTWVPAWK